MGFERTGLRRADEMEAHWGIVGCLGCKDYPAEVLLHDWDDPFGEPYCISCVELLIERIETLAEFPEAVRFLGPVFPDE